MIHLTLPIYVPILHEIAYSLFGQKLSNNIEAPIIRIIGITSSPENKL